MIKNIYIKKLENNKLYNDIKKQIVLGYMIGFILTFLSLFNILFVIESNIFFWKLIFAIGLIIWFLAFSIPQSLILIERAWSFYTKFICKMIFLIILIIIYFLIITPFGLLFRRTNNSKYFISWNKKNELNNKIISWIPKESDLNINILKNKKGSIFYQFYLIIYFFAKNKQWWLIPIIIFLLLLGLILFFIQTSVLAPFIYTIF